MKYFPENNQTNDLLIVITDLSAYNIKIFSILRSYAVKSFVNHALLQTVTLENKFNSHNINVLLTNGDFKITESFIEGHLCRNRNALINLALLYTSHNSQYITIDTITMFNKQFQEYLNKQQPIAAKNNSKNAHKQLKNYFLFKNYSFPNTFSNLQYKSFYHVPSQQVQSKIIHSNNSNALLYFTDINDLFNVLDADTWVSSSPSLLKFESDIYQLTFDNNSENAIHQANSRDCIHELTNSSGHMNDNSPNETPVLSLQQILKSLYINNDN